MRNNAASTLMFSFWCILPAVAHDYLFIYLYSQGFLKGILPIKEVSQEEIYQTTTSLLAGNLHKSHRQSCHFYAAALEFPSAVSIRARRRFIRRPQTHQYYHDAERQTEHKQKISWRCRHSCGGRMQHSPRT